MISLSQCLPSIAIKSSGQYPIGQVVGYRVTNPFDVIRELAALPSVVVLQVNDLLNQVLGLAFDNEGRRRWLVVVQECIGVFGLQLGDMEDRVNVNGGGQLEGERHSRRLGDDGKGANLLFC